MAINKNHEFEELNGVKCGIVEKKVTAERAAFLQSLLTSNGYTVVVVPSPPEKAVPPSAVKTADDKAAPDMPTLPVSPETYTIGVTDVTFNPINAVFGRLLKTAAGHVVSQAYWLQQEDSAVDDVPYYERTKTTIASSNLD